MIQGDSDDYDLLKKWSKDFDCNGYYSVEIGVREGQGSKIIMDNVKNNYLHIGVDPYGDLDYKHFDDQENYTWTGLEKGKAPTYPDSMRDQMIADFTEYSRKGKFHFANMKDSDFMQHSVYSGLMFSFIFLDGPHTTKDVMSEAIWFANRSAKKTRMIFDDYLHYNMPLIEECLTYFGFKQIDRGNNKFCMEKNGN
jgi:hypothetical protein|tara:strand:+ start:122 stop:709 length:588 start_codon:yes stop_codon:yes gene_type:complete